jgi:hypothetical protein
MTVLTDEEIRVIGAGRITIGEGVAVGALPLVTTAESGHQRASL